MHVWLSCNFFLIFRNTCMFLLQHICLTAYNNESNFCSFGGVFLPCHLLYESFPECIFFPSQINGSTGESFLLCAISPSCPVCVLPCHISFFWYPIFLCYDYDYNFQLAAFLHVCLVVFTDYFFFYLVFFINLIVIIGCPPTMYRLNALSLPSALWSSKCHYWSMCLHCFLLTSLTVLLCCSGDLYFSFLELLVRICVFFWLLLFCTIGWCGVVLHTPLLSYKARFASVWISL